jgi:hypothetical protein
MTIATAGTFTTINSKFKDSMFQRVENSDGTVKAAAKEYAE